MSECPYQSRLSEFHDHELDSQTAEKLESHLAGCPACNEQLQGIRAVSRLFREAPSGRMSQMGITRLHAVADTAAKRRHVFPMFRMLTAVAASILIIAGAWLIESQGQTGVQNVQYQDPAEVPIWEKLAGGGKLALPGEVNRASDVAAAPESGKDLLRSHFQAWMIESLKQNSGS